MRPRVFITGASSGIGLALAFEFAARGYDLALAARRGELLDATARDIVARHPSCDIRKFALDVTRYEDVFTTLRACHDATGKIDIVIANAGALDRGRVGHGHFDKHRRTIETNVLGAMATCDAAVQLFRRQGCGQLVVISSVAAFRGLPGGAAYAASKAAIARYAESVRAETLGSGIAVTTLFPGYIDTPINRDVAHRPFLIGAERGAKLLADKIERRVHTATVPAFPWAILRRVAWAIPTRWVAARYRR